MATRRIPSRFQPQWRHGAASASFSTDVTTTRMFSTNLRNRWQHTGQLSTFMPASAFAVSTHVQGNASRAFAALSNMESARASPPAAIRKLMKFGVTALQAQWHPSSDEDTPVVAVEPSIVSDPAQPKTSQNSSDGNDGFNSAKLLTFEDFPLKKPPRVKDGTWHPSMVSSRKARVIRKRALQTGTYGSFDATTGIGWDASWDVILATNNGRSRSTTPHASSQKTSDTALFQPRPNSESVGRYRIAIPKKAAYVRRREQRAQKIEKALESVDQLMEDYYVERQKRKPPKNFDTLYKKLMKGRK
jgi:hypothetical protein